MGNFKSGIIADSEASAKSELLSRREGKVMKHNTISNVSITKVTKVTQDDDDLWIIEGTHVTSKIEEV